MLPTVESPSTSTASIETDQIPRLQILTNGMIDMQIKGDIMLSPDVNQ